MNRKSLPFLSIFIFLFVFCFPVTDAISGEKEGLYSQLNRGIIRLEHTALIKLEGSDQVRKRHFPDGTAFFVSSGKDLFVVSARHVVERDYDLHARVQARDNKTGEIRVFILKLPRDRWIFHPDQGDEDTHYVDVAVTKINRIKGHQIKSFRYEISGSQGSKKNQLPMTDPEPPTPVLVFGFPGDIGFKLSEQKPLGRSGIVSMVTGKKFLRMKGKYVESKAYLVDAEVFGGNSGSPVIMQPFVLRGKILLLGLITGTNNRFDFAIVEPVSRIRETLDIAKDQPVKDLEFWLGPPLD